MSGIRWRTPLVVLAACASLVFSSSAAADVVEPGIGSGCPSVNGNWAGPGPFAVTKQVSLTGHTIFRPAQLGSLGCAKHPVILWGNGTFATPSFYADLLWHWASHGFIVAAANTTQAGSGDAMLRGLDYLTRENSAAGSVFHGKVDTGMVGATGHSQGGGGAINAGEDPRVDVTIPIEPGPFGTIDLLRGPMFILGGENDTTVNPDLLVIPRYEDADHIVAIYGELAGASHLTPMGDGGGFRGPMTAWFRFFLMGDEQGRDDFFGPGCGNCVSPIWSDFRRNTKAQAYPGH
ncbi:MAG: acetylxylan esterase [Actinomycetota bacterium]|nr:acetylxylan esterase [Actinomycetota bacterium]